MTLDRARLAERAAAVERHLRRVADRLPPAGEPLEAMTDASDAVILHLWQATQIVIDLAMSVAVDRDAGAPATYADAFVRLGERGVLGEDLARRLVRATGFRNVLVHAYEDLDMERVREAAIKGPPDLRAFLAALRDHLEGG